MPGRSALMIYFHRKGDIPMISRYTFGHPIQTDAVVTPLPASPLPIPHFAVTTDPLTLTCPLAEDAAVYGLGENVRGINKRGWIYESFCSDDPHHQEDKRSLYGAHNVLIVSTPDQVFGLFVDDPGRVTFDVGYTRYDTLTITSASGDADVYLLEGETELELVRQLRGLTGRSYIPPKWALGFSQSRWSYLTADEVRQVARGYHDKEMPLDMICLDIDYMEDYKDFTVDAKTFPDLAGLSRELKEEGVRLVPIIDAGVKIQPGYDVYEEGVAGGFFCKDEDGEDFVAAVWPGQVHFPDVLNPEARSWFGLKYKRLTDLGIEGFWNDMNEPAIFYSQKGLAQAMEQIEHYQGKNLDINTFFQFTGLVNGLSNSRNDYASFYHTLEDGSVVRHDKVHNLFGYNMTRAAGEALEELVPGRRTLLYSRASYIGMHRYGGIWQGDNQSWWSHLELNIKMMPSVNLAGFLYTGADLGGFGSDTTEDLLLRWMAFGLFTPLMRNHSAMGTRRQELYAYPRWEIFRELIRLRYYLLPYLYSEFMKAALNEGMLFRPLAFDYRRDPQARQVEDQLLLGESVMLAPVYRQNAAGRYVYLPEEMKLVRLKAPGVWAEEILSAGHHYIPVALDEVPLFLRPDKLVPVAKTVGLSVEDTDFRHLGLLSFVKDRAEYLLYDDDGVTRDYDRPEHFTRITLDADGSLTVEGEKSVQL